MKSFYISTPDEFDFSLALDFLKRSPKEKLHTIDGDSVIKATHVGESAVLLRVKASGKRLLIQVLNRALTESEQSQVKNFVREWLDLETDLKPFYNMAKKDKLLSGLIQRFRGYRIVGQPDLYESLIWAVLGQQINLGFAYTLKQQFVEKYGDAVEWDGQRFYLFPSYQNIANISPDELLPLQFSRQKANYTVGISQAFAEGKISKQLLFGLPLPEAKEILIQTKGIGNWTANYALMKTFRYRDAFPLEDAGVHNAIKNLKRMKAKPTLAQVKSLFKKYKGWEAYATLYLWKSL
ncbi:MAG: DNA-3-methyladenine glycosylase [Cytophagales bacterium]|nr:DNA-3-methyladenine glycosylase [Cytophagales bacterium]